MIDLADAMDALKVALETESTLRVATSTEWAGGITQGPMRKAHDVSIEYVLAAAHALLTKSVA
jgi:hypothetical protein